MSTGSRRDGVNLASAEGLYRVGATRCVAARLSVGRRRVQRGAHGAPYASYAGYSERMPPKFYRPYSSKRAFSRPVRRSAMTSNDALAFSAR